MTVTTLDPKTALVIVDLQKGIISLPTAHPAADVVKNAGVLADAFTRTDLDAMTDISVEAHDNSVARIFPRIGETGTTAEIVALLP